MADLVESSNGRVVGFVPFDPRRGNGMEIIKYGLTHGNCGVKVYPPLGYLPFGNNQTEHIRLEGLYKHCSDEKIPVLTHCTPVGFQSYKGAGVLCDPVNWTPVLKQFPDLILNFGHAGGGGAKNLDPVTGEKVYYPGWYSEDSDRWEDDRNFARKVLEHCRNKPNVYCDFSYVEDMLNDSEKAKHFKRNFLAAYEDTETPYKFADKAMYGSDWHMPNMIRHTAEFLDFLIELFDNPVLHPHKEKFFYKNALKFLNLEKFIDRHKSINPNVLSADTIAAFEEKIRLSTE